MIKNSRTLVIYITKHIKTKKKIKIQFTDSVKKHGIEYNR
jgi:hypothetical protein